MLFNKADLGAPGFDARDAPGTRRAGGSVFDPTTLGALQRRIAQVGWGGERIDLRAPHLASARQADAVARAREVAGAARARRSPPATRSISSSRNCSRRLAALGEITGAAATEAILDGIFARFCVGK